MPPSNPEEKKKNTFIKKLKEYQELIAILVFFLGGFLWLLGYFATKTQLDELKCFTQANIGMIQGKVNVQFYNDMIKENSSRLCEENEALEKAVKNSNGVTELKKRISNLEDQKSQFINNRDTAQKAMEEALVKLTNNSCGQLK